MALQNRFLATSNRMPNTNIQTIVRSPGMEVSVVGPVDLGKRLAEMDEFTDLYPAMQNVAIRAENRAKTFAPSETGLLKESIKGHVVLGKDFITIELTAGEGGLEKGVEYATGSGNSLNDRASRLGQYALYQEVGSIKNPARRYLSKSMEVSNRDMIRVFNRGFNNKI